MDLVIRGTPGPARRETMGHGEDQSVEPGRTGPEGVRTRVAPGRTGPEGVEGRAEGARESRQQLSASVHQREPKAQCRVAAAAEWPSLKQLQQFQSERASQPVMRGW